jgi:hypothetical protein
MSLLRAFRSYRIDHDRTQIIREEFDNLSEIVYFQNLPVPSNFVDLRDDFISTHQKVKKER